MAIIRRDGSSFLPRVPARDPGQSHANYIARLRMLHERECQWGREGRWQYRPEYAKQLSDAIKREEAYSHGSVES